MKARFMSVVCADVLLTRDNGKEFLLMKRINTGSNLNPKIGESNKCSELIWGDFDDIPSNTMDKV